MFITDDQVAMLAAGITVTGSSGRERTLAGVGVAAWLQQRSTISEYSSNSANGCRICEHAI